jgi:hypothetical protein
MEKPMFVWVLSMTNSFDWAKEKTSAVESKSLDKSFIVIPLIVKI